MSLINGYGPASALRKTRGVGMKLVLVLSLAVVLACIALAQSPGTFTLTGSMTAPRVSHAATLLSNGKVLITGGAYDDFTRVTATAELYDPSTGTFTPTGMMTTPRVGHTATLLADGSVLIAGGFDVIAPERSAAQFYSTAEVYDPTTGAFSATGSMTTAFGLFSATLLADGRVLINGCAVPCNSAVAELYDPRTREFARTVGTPPEIRPSGDGRGGTSTLLADGSVLISGGCKAQLFTPAGLFTSTGDMTGQCSSYSWTANGQQPGYYAYTASLLTNGKVLFIGSGEDGPVDVELYDPATKIFTTGGTIAVKYYSAATVIADGTVLITGEDAQMYLPANGTFAEIMNPRRNSHTATLLPDGTVLLAGGWTGIAVIASAEIYRPGLLIPSPALLSLSGDGRGQGAILHAGTPRLASSSDPAVAGQYLEIYLRGLTNGSFIPPQVSIGGRMAEVLWFGNTPAFPELNQINVRVPSGVLPGAAVPVRLRYMDRASNEVTIGVQ